MEAEEFEALLREKRFNEIIGILKNILVSLKPKDDNSKVEGLLRQILEKEEKSFPQSIEIIGQEILKKVSEEDTKQWLFTIERDSQGLIKTVLAK